MPTGTIVDRRRRVSLITPVPKPKKRKAQAKQEEIVFEEGHGLSTKDQQYELTSRINEVRLHVETWRNLPASQWQVTPETARLLHHWRHHSFSGIRPFFCQVEAVETAIWLSEAAAHTVTGRKVLDYLKQANRGAGTDLERVALKLATGAGKTAVMAMLIAWQTVNAVRRPGSKTFTRGFLVVTPGLTVKDRLRVLQPSDPRQLLRLARVGASRHAVRRAEGGGHHHQLPRLPVARGVSGREGHPRIVAGPDGRGAQDSGDRGQDASACDA